MFKSVFNNESIFNCINIIIDKLSWLLFNFPNPKNNIIKELQEIIKLRQCVFYRMR